MNDPHGLLHLGGRYHAFYQAVPDSLEWRPDCLWGHAVSDDLTTWRHLPPALVPDQDESGIWSGSAVTTGDSVWLFYTSVQLDDHAVARIRVARSRDDQLLSWRKGSFVADGSTLPRLVVFRDPFVFKHEDEWLMVVGAGFDDGVAAVLLFASPELQAGWQLRGVMASRSGQSSDPVWTGDAWECPQLIKVDDVWVLVVSVWSQEETHYVACAVGDFDGFRFTAMAWHRLTYGPSPYAATVFEDADGRHALCTWLRRMRDRTGTWCGAMSLPLAVSTSGDRVRLRPHPSVPTSQRVPAPGARMEVPPEEPLVLQWHASAAPRDALTVHDADGTELMHVMRTAEGVVVREGDGLSWEAPDPGGSMWLVIDGLICEILAENWTGAVPLSCGASEVRRGG